MASSPAQALKVIHADESYEGKQGLTCFTGVSAENAGSKGLCMHLLRIPPGGRAKAHLHANHESAIYTLRGEALVWHGEGLRESIVTGPGDFLYIPPGMPHLPVNRSKAAPCVAIIARTDPNEQESVVLLPDLDDRVPA